MATRTAWNPVTGEVITEANLEKLPGGWIGWAVQTTSQSGISTVVTDLTGLSVTVTVGDNRLIRVSAHATLRQTVSSGLPTLLIREGSSTLQQAFDQSAAADFRTFSPFAILTPSAGSHTYKLSASTSGGNVETVTDGTKPVLLVVEDLGPAS